VAAAPRPIIAIGPSHIQLNFLNFTGLDHSVALLIDDLEGCGGKDAAPKGTPS